MVSRGEVGDRNFLLRNNGGNGEWISYCQTVESFKYINIYTYIYFFFLCKPWGTHAFKMYISWYKHEPGMVWMCCVFSHVLLFVTPWTVARQAPLSMGFSRQECWSGLLYPIPVVWMRRNKTGLEAWRFLQQSGSKVINAWAKRWQVFCRSKRDFMELWQGFNNN